MSKKVTTEDFIERSIAVHGNKYDYSKVVYKKAKEKVCIICPEHGEFWQKPNHHVYGIGCPKCSGNVKLTTDVFIERAQKVHGDKYDYSKVEYDNVEKNVLIICREHGDFAQTPYTHMKGGGCPKCAKTKIVQSKVLTTEEFIERAKKTHGDKYIYSKVEYEWHDLPVCIICPEHGEFWQKPFKHIAGHGCPSCNKSKLECDVEKLLIENNITYEPQKKFQWLKYKSFLSIDFYLPKFNIGIECQGLQHFEPLDFFGGCSTFEALIKRDSIKRELCKSHGINLIYYSIYNIEYPYPVIKGEKNMMEKLKSLNL